MNRTTNTGPGVGSVDPREVRAMQLMHGRSLSKGPAVFAPRSVHTSASGSMPAPVAARATENAPQSGPSESVRLRWFLIGAAFALATVFLLDLFVRAGLPS